MVSESTRRRLSCLQWAIIGSIVVVAVGAILHELYKWSGRHASLQWLGATNESVWEHIKIGVWPHLIVTLLMFSFGVCGFDSAPKRREAARQTELERIADAAGIERQRSLGRADGKEDERGKEEAQSCSGIPRRTTDASAKDLLFGRAVGLLVLMLFIPVVFYSYTQGGKQGKSILTVDILTFVAAAILSNFILCAFSTLPWRASWWSSALGITIMSSVAALTIAWSYTPPSERGLFFPYSE